MHHGPKRRGYLEISLFAVDLQERTRTFCSGAEMMYRSKLAVMLFRNLRPIVCLILLSLSLGFANRLAAQTELPVAATGTVGNYKIGVGDLLKIVVPKQTLLSLDSARVNYEGKIRLPMLNEDIQAACLTENELAGSISEKYRKYLLDPQVYVTVTEFNSNSVAFIGAVNSPGKYDLKRPARLLELLAFVNGPSPKAGKKIQIIRRKRPDLCGENAPRVEVKDDNPQQILAISLDDLMKGEETANPYVSAGDIILLPEATAPEEAYVIGNVASPRAITLDQPIRLSKAIAMAGGVTKGGKKKKIRITRQDAGSTSKREIIVNLEDINRGLKEDVLLMANDIIDVPGPKPSFLKDIFRSVLPRVTRGVLYY